MLSEKYLDARSKANGPSVRAPRVTVQSDASTTTLRFYVTALIDLLALPTYMEIWPEKR
jgi:hypothetical protein